MSFPKLAIILALSSLAFGQSRVRGGALFIGGVSGQNIATPAAPSVEDNINCNASNVWIGGVSDGPALLPTNCINTAIANTPAPSGQLQATITNASLPTPMSAFKTELTAAVCGEIIVIAAGTVLTSATALDLTFPSKGCDSAHWIWVVTSVYNSAFPIFPPPGQRITPCFAGVSVASTPEIQWPIDNSCSNAIASISTTSAQASTITFAPGADHYRFIGIKFTRPGGAFGYKILTASRDLSAHDTYTVTGNLGASGAVVGMSINVAGTSNPSFNKNQTITSITLPSTFTTTQIGQPSGTATGGEMSNVYDQTALITMASDPANGPHHIIFDRSFIGGTPDTETSGGLKMGDANNIAVIESWIDEIHCYVTIGACTDAKTISGGVGTNPNAGTYKIVNNFLEASGESTIFGGGPATVVPNDLEFRRNWLYKPAYWNPLDLSNYNGGGPPPTGTAAFNVKNAGELKNFNRVLYEGNVTSRSFITSDQRGDGFVISPKSQAGLCPICAVTNLTIRYQEGGFFGRGMQIVDAASNGGPADGALAAAGNTYSIHDIVFDDIGNPLTGSQSPQMFTMFGLPQFNLSKVTMNHVTFLSDHTALMVTMGGPPATWTAGKPVLAGDTITPCRATSPCSYTDPPTVFVALGNGTTGVTEPVWPARLSGSNIGDNGITWHEDSVHLNLYLMDQMVIKNSIFSSTAGDGFHTTGGGNTNCINNTPPNPTVTQKLDACWAPGYVFGPNVIYGTAGSLTWPAGNFFPANGNSVGFVAYNSGAGGDYRLCTDIGVPDPACLVASPYASTGAHPADDAKDMGADIGLIDSKTAGVEVFQ